MAEQLVTVCVAGLITARTKYLLFRVLLLVFVSLNVLKSAHLARAAGTVHTRYRVPGKGQLKDLAGFLVSRSLTLPYLLIFAASKKRKCKQHSRYKINLRLGVFVIFVGS